ncbi:Starch-binding associating with outer membrane [Lutibacter oricola]|uniref:Starch-binding associating with outer membrane n=1 Tax=Lutibacter oricola TaxID=762486 RepID=A0A1H3FRX4_9FLAO|nr:RagB/SusD family nutrient uptake outer membrane protein [Lutibacter oricola]SDX93691.1 Starch-binding associating with outer membrane [Lutibacter oricola]
MKQIKFLTLLILAVFISSCEDDFLSPELVSAENGDTYYANDAEIETAVVNIYDGVQGVNQLELTSSGLNYGVQNEYYLTEMRSDNTRTKSSEGEAAQFENYTLESTNGIVLNYYRSYYNIIFRANTVLENLDAATDSGKVKFEAEAKFLRAYAYFNLVRLFGDVPLVDKLINPADTETSFTRVATSTIYELIVADLQTAASGLTDGSKDRASKSAAQTLLAKVYLTLGNYGDAKTLLESVMSSGFTLQDNFVDLFYTERNSEIIFAIGYEASDVYNSQNFSAEWLNAVGRTSGVNYVTDDAVAALDAMGGNRAMYSYRIDPAQVTQHQVVKYLPNGDEDLGIPVTSGDPTSAGNDWIVLRYADVLLMYVEAVMAGADATLDASAIEAFQKVRDRAGLTDTVTSITKQELLDERRVELAFENHRLFDLIRFGVAQEVLSAFSSANGYSFSATDLLLPIPQSEIGLSNGVLTQNPGY